MRWTNLKPARPWAALLAALPFAAAILAYVVASDLRRAENPQDRLLPAPAQLADTARRVATEPDRRSGEILLWIDTGASLRRLGIGLGVSAALGLSFGLALGMIPAARAGLSPFVAVVSLIPPLAVLPILFIAFGLGELSKIALIVIGTAPVLIRDLAQRALEIPTEMRVKAETLGASSWTLLTRIGLPQLMPRLIQGLRLALAPGWLFLIAAEAIASTEGLGYRIFLVRRFFAMDVILVYVAWIALLAFFADLALRTLQRRAFPWAGEAA
jgi:NitT/TauT family transport system permease protein